MEAATALDAPARAGLAAALLAVDPHGLGGAVLRAGSHESTTQWLDQLRALLPESTPHRRLPLTITDDRLLGGLDLAMTLATGTPVAERGLLAVAHNGVVVLPCAERASGGLVSRLAQALDTGRIPNRAPGFHDDIPAAFALIALDESIEAEEHVAAALTDRLAFLLALDAAPVATEFTAADVAVARTRLSLVQSPSVLLGTVVNVAASFGIWSLRAVHFALRAARALAALDGRTTIEEHDLSTAMVLILAPRATQMPAAAPPEPEQQSPEDEPPPPDQSEQKDDPDATLSEEEIRAIEEMLVQTIAAALPAGLSLNSDTAPRSGATNGGTSGDDRAGGIRGRQVGTRRGDPRTGGRLDLVETLRAAAPWQRIRRAALSPERLARVGVQVRPDDFRLRRLVEPAGTTVIFVVDASGSAALNRMAEAKGAVELLLAESYARRDEVGLIAFRGSKAEVLLAPTRAIAAARRALAALPGGGGTPMANAIDAAREMATLVRRTGNDTVVVFLTDARANVARDGSGGRPQAEADAVASAQALRLAGGTTMLIDTSPRPGPAAQRISEAMGARYVPLPRTDAQAIHAVVSSARAELRA